MAATVLESPVLLTPQGQEKLEDFQHQPHILQHDLILRPSKSEDINQRPQLVCPEKSVSSTHAERRKDGQTIPASLCLESKNTVKEEKEIKRKENAISQTCLIKVLEKQKSDSKSISMDTTVTPLLDNSTATEPFWENFIKNANSIEARAELLRKLAHGHDIPKDIRGVVWQAICQTSKASRAAVIYDQLKNESSAFDTMIEKDIQEMNDRECIMRVLKAYSLYDARVGYLPGMAQLVSPLLIYMPENEAFSVLTRLMETYDMRSLYMLNMEGLHLRLEQFKIILAQTLPKLYEHLSRLSIYPSMYASQWYLTIFTSCISSQQHIARIYDIALLEGVVETVIRMSILLLQKNEAHILSLDQHEDVLNYLTSTELHSSCYVNSDEGGRALVHDIIKMNPMVAKLDHIANTQANDLEREKSRTHAAMTTWRMKKEKIASVQTIPRLQQQIEDLVTAMSQLQKEHAALAQSNMSLRMREVDQEAAQSKLAKRNAVLEKRIKKYKVKLANATTHSESDDVSPTTLSSALPSPNTAAIFASLPTSMAPEGIEVNVEHMSDKRQDQYNSFVASLRGSGDFGALIAGALAPKLADEEKEQQLEKKKDMSETEKRLLEEQENRKKIDMTLQNVTSELVAIKLDHFETKQRYETLYHHCEQLTAQIQSMQESQNTLVQKIIYLESELDDAQAERDQILQDQEEVLDVAMVAKKTAAELQFEKLAMAKEMERLEHVIKELEEEKKAFFMPRSSFTEEVFAAHSILFGPSKLTSQKEANRRHTMQLGSHKTADDEYKTKFVESELRCRELEKYLAETKVRLAEFESGTGTISSPRGSIQLQRRASLYNNKRSSAASLSMLANRMSTPTSPRERRGSTESYASSVTSLTSVNSSNYNSKRSSMYSRIWNAFGTPTTPINTTVPNNIKSEVLCQEPEIIEQQ
ncbi:rab-GTPase-TBC domain-containing protein [Blakeslea trispora]|nr:rab-GTPase-TBC domain-containing protein [Blakeslea trispora]